MHTKLIFGGVAALVIAVAACGGNVVVDGNGSGMGAGFSVGGGNAGGSNNAGGMGGTFMSSTAVVGTASTGTGTGTGVNCSLDGCSGSSEVCQCAGTCNGQDVELECTTGTQTCVCIVDGVTVATCAATGDMCSDTDCCANYFATHG
jgi:hypothetical protein